MTITDKIFLRQKRGFSQLFGTVFKLVRKNFSVLVGSLFITAGPFILLTAVFTAWLNSTIFRPFIGLSQNLFRGDITQTLSDVITNAAGWVALIWVFSLLSYSFIRTTMANFFVIYESKLEGESFTVQEIARKTYKDVWMVFTGMIVFSLVSFVVLAIVAIPFFLLCTSGVGGIIFAIFLLFIILIAFGPQLGYIFSYAPPFVMVRDKVFVFTAIKRTIANIKGNFWWLWVLMICMGLIIGIFSMITNLPATIYQMGNTFGRSDFGTGDPEEMLNSATSPVYIALYSFGLFCGSVITCLADMLMAVSYYSFEEERTGMGLSLKIDEIGRPEENPNYN
ncbi:MAG: hypothetical protein IAF38_12320 [Bacteroidia bacterium]|nr:hypothetical protein [Bacteroidia bacterium]